MVIAKLKDRIVQIVKVQESVIFTEEKGWILVCFDFDKPDHKRDHIKWMKASETKFEWVREFVGA